MAGSSSDAVFEWGDKEPGTESSYESMCFKGIWYNLYDCVLCKSGRRLPFVGKLMRLFEDKVGAKKVRIRWFFRPYELPVGVIKDLPNEIHNSNELFIALGSVKGVENENVVEVIQGKAMVLCTARFERNILPSHVHAGTTNYVFNRAYNVVKQKVVKIMSISNKHLVHKFANKAEWIPHLEIVEVEEQKPTTIDDSKSSSSKIDLPTRETKRSLMITMVEDSCNLQPVKKMKGKEKIEDEEIWSVVYRKK